MNAHNSGVTLIYYLLFNWTYTNDNSDDIYRLSNKNSKCLYLLKPN